MSAPLACPQPEEISIVVQGPVSTDPYRQTQGPLTAGVLRQLRELLPGAELILSTWEGTDTTGLTYDRVVYCPDPGPQRSTQGPKKGTGFNLNRQIVSVQQGLAVAQRPYVLRTRTDLPWSHVGFLDYWSAFPHRGSTLRLSQERLIVCSNFTRNPFRYLAAPFSVCDWFTFGLSEDVKAYWQAPLFPDSYMNWFEQHPEAAPKNLLPPMSRYGAEQYLCLNWMQRLGASVELEHYYDWSERQASQLPAVLANNFIILDQSQIGLRFVKYAFRPLECWLANYEHVDWLALYRQYCEPGSIPVPSFHRYLKALAAAGLQHSPIFHALFRKVDSALFKLVCQPRTGPVR